MPELHLPREGDTLAVTLDGYTTGILWADVAATESTREALARGGNATVYGRHLYDLLFADDALRRWSPDGDRRRRMYFRRWAGG